MIAAARRHEADEPLGIEYLVEDAATLRALPTAAFDLVTCQLGLMDIPDLTATLAAVHRVLWSGGSFVFVIGHPCFLAPDAQTITTTGERPRPAHHRLPARAVLEITKPARSSPPPTDQYRARGTGP
jgi:ubiquinone/menaquinone biosynthesis C-methylase UbiE